MDEWPRSNGVMDLQADPSTSNPPSSSWGLSQEAMDTGIPVILEYLPCQWAVEGRRVDSKAGWNADAIPRTIALGRTEVAWYPCYRV